MQERQDEKERASYFRSLKRHLLLYRKGLTTEELEKSMIASSFHEIGILFKLQRTFWQLAILSLAWLAWDLTPLLPEASNKEGWIVTI